MVALGRRLALEILLIRALLQLEDFIQEGVVLFLEYGGILAGGLPGVIVAAVFGDFIDEEQAKISRRVFAP